MARIELVIFDFDGTLVDTAPDLIRSANFYLESQGFDTLSPELIRSRIGEGLRKLIADVHPEAEKSADLIRRIEGDFLQIYEREYLHNPRLFEGAVEFLSDWEGQIAIVSNKRERFIRPILQKLEIDALPWSSIVGGDTFGNMKPHPEPLLAAMEAAGVTPDETIIVGDGHPDVQGALAVGSRCVAVEFGYTPSEELMALGAWATLADYSDLRALVRSIT